MKKGGEIITITEIEIQKYKYQHCTLSNPLSGP